MFFEDFLLGTSWKIEPFTIDKTEITTFARRYDPMRFHLDENFASQTRFGALFASGYLTFLKAWATFADAHPDFQEGILAGAKTTVEWMAPVYPGDQLHGRLRVTEVKERNRYNGTVRLGSDLYNQTETCVLTADVEIIFLKRLSKQVSK